VDSPSIAIHWDPETQTIQVIPDKDRIKNWEFVIGLLRMAQDVCEQKRRGVQVAQLQRQAMSQAQGDAIARKVLQG
jgi:hypothetical protein